MHTPGPRAHSPFRFRFRFRFRPFRSALPAAAALLLAGCASVSPNGLRGDVQAILQGRTAGADGAALPSTAPAAQRAADDAVTHWLAAPLTQEAAVRIALLRRTERREGPVESWLWLLTDGRTLERPAAPTAAHHVVVVDFDDPARALGRCADWARGWGAEHHRARS